MKPFTLTMVTPKGKVFDDQVASVTAPGVCGSFAVLPHHAPLLAALDRGVVKVQSGRQTQFYVIDGGVLEVHDNHATLLAEDAEPVRDLVDGMQRLKHPGAEQTINVEPGA